MIFCRKSWNQRLVWFERDHKSSLTPPAMGGTPLTWPSSLNWPWTIPKWRWWEGWSAFCEDSLREVELSIWRKFQGDLISSFWYWRRPTGKQERDFVQGNALIRWEGMSLNWKRFQLDIRKILFTVRIVRHWNKLSREFVDIPSLSVCLHRRDWAIHNDPSLYTQGWSESINSLSSLHSCMGLPWLRCRTWHLASLDFKTFMQPHLSSLTGSPRLASLPFSCDLTSQLSVAWTFWGCPWSPCPCHQQRCQCWFRLWPLSDISCD